MEFDPIWSWKDGESIVIVDLSSATGIEYPNGQLVVQLISGGANNYGTIVPKEKVIELAEVFQRFKKWKINQN